MTRPSIGQLVARVVMFVLVVAVIVIAVSSRHASDEQPAPPTASPSTSTAPTTSPSPRKSATTSEADRTEQIIAQRLDPFLKAYFTYYADESAASRSARVASVTPPTLKGKVEVAIAGIPAGAIMTPSVDDTKMTVERPDNSQYYVVMPVSVRLTQDGTTYLLEYKTATVWEKRSGEWKPIHFAHDGGIVVNQYAAEASS